MLKHCLKNKPKVLNQNFDKFIINLEFINLLN
jgi:hypothetical protein